MINQNGFQNGLACAYFPTYLSKTFRKIGWVSAIIRHKDAWKCYLYAYHIEREPLTADEVCTLWLSVHVRTEFYSIKLIYQTKKIISTIKKIQTETGLLENMSTQMEVDDGAIITTLSRTSCVGPVLRTSCFVKK